MSDGWAKTMRPYATGGSAACFASFCIHPIDVTKVRLQIVPPPATAMSVAKSIVKHDGVKGLYAGCEPQRRPAPGCCRRRCSCRCCCRRRCTSLHPSGRCRLHV